MTDKEKDQQEDLKLREQEDGSVIIGDEPPPPPKVEEDEDDAPIKSEEHVDDEEEAGHAEETPEEAEARKERNRKRRSESKQRRKDYIESLRRELSARDRIINELSTRVQAVERRSTGSEMAQLERAEKEAVQAYNTYKEINAKAIEQANGAVANDAQEKMFQARQRIEHLRNIRTNMSKQQQAPQPLDPRLVNHAQEWMGKNKWYDPSGKDEDSAIALTIDNRMAAEGWDPTTPEYWQELSARVNKYLPHRSSSGYNKSQDVEKRPPPPVAGSGRGSSASGSSAYKLSSERVTALKEAGLWDDPKARAEAIKRFQQFDKEQRQ
jgi:hypothetical protein